MPSEAAKSIEKLYWDLIRAMSPEEKYRKTLSLNASVRAVVETQIRDKHPELSDRAVKFAVARRRYWNEPKVLQMLDEMERTEKDGTNE